MSLFQLGDFWLSSGRKSDFKIDCDALSEEDWRTLAVLIARLVGPFASVEGVPRGGLKLAEKLRESRSDVGGHLIVDDVLTTGGSMERLRSCYAVDGDTYPMRARTRGAVVFARGPCPAWVTPLFTLTEGGEDGR